jgi:hypothetical protein
MVLFITISVPPPLMAMPPPPAAGPTLPLMTLSVTASVPPQQTLIPPPPPRKGVGRVVADGAVYYRQGSTIAVDAAAIAAAVDTRVTNGAVTECEPSVFLCAGAWRSPSANDSENYFL